MTASPRNGRPNGPKAGPSPPPAPPPRQGPRPLGQHLGTALAVLLSSPLGLHPSRSGLLPWRPALAPRASALQPRLASADPDRLLAAVDQEMRARLDGLLTGVERYRRHPYHRRMPATEIAWAAGSAQLFAFGGEGPPVLFAPSLINRGYVLDLMEERSLMRWLATQGLRPFLLEWGAPGPEEMTMDVSRLLARRLEPALEQVAARTGRKPALVGYCMGGTLTVAAAERRPDLVAALGLLAAPWDFHAGDAGPDGQEAGRGLAARQIAAMMPMFEPALRATGALPVDAIQSLFAALDPLLALRKFLRFAAMDPAGEDALSFVALEDWLNDGIVLPEPIARECLDGWYGANDTALGRWRVDGRPVRPEALRLPTLVLVPSQDRIVPPASAQALGRAIPGADMRTVPLGHIGMVVSRGAGRRVWEPLRDWLKAQAPAAAAPVKKPRRRAASRSRSPGS